MLENFRAQKIVWDWANNQIYDLIEASGGDTNGRKLDVTILNGSTVENLTGGVLSLAWHYGEHQGLDAFTEIDATKGKFEIYYTTGMLSNHGTLTASLVLVDVKGRIESKPFDIVVRPGIVDDEAVQSENSFTALTEALVKVSQVQADFDSLYTEKEQMMDDLRDEKSTDMDTLYAQKELALDTLHDTKKADLEALEQDFEDRADNLETTYAPRLTGVEGEIDVARGGATTLGERLDSNEADLAEKASKIDLSVEKSRIDLLIAPQAGVDNAETADIRVGYDGETYSSAGKAVRDQFIKLQSNLINEKVYRLSDCEKLEKTSIRDDNTIGGSTTRNLYYIRCEPETAYEVETSIVDSYFALAYAKTRPKKEGKVYGTTRNATGNKLRIQTDVNSAWLVIVQASSDLNVKITEKAKIINKKNLEYSEESIRKGIDILESMLQNGKYELKKDDFKNRYILPDGKFINEETRISTNYLRFYKNDYIDVKLGSTSNNMFVVVLDDDLNKIETVEKFDDGVVTPFNTREKGYVVIAFGYNYNNAISSESYDAEVSINKYIHAGQETETLNVKFEKGKYDDTADRYGGPVANWKAYTINKYPIVLHNNSTSVHLPVIDFSTEATGIVIFRDSSGGTLLTKTFICDNPSTNIDVPVNAYYMDLQIANNGLNDLEVNISYNGTKKPKEEKRIYVNSNNPTINYIEIDRERNLYTGMCYMLPTNYSNTGEKVPLVVWFDGNAGYNKMGRRFSEAKIHGLTYLRDEGYAVMQVFSWGSNYADKYPDCGLDQPYPVPTALSCIKKGIEYMIDRFNVDENDVHISSKSMGGLISLYFASRPIYDFKSIGMFSPILDMFGLRGRYPDARRAIFEDMDFDGDMSEFADISFDGTTSDGVENYYFSDRCINNIWVHNKSKLLRLNPAWTDLVGSDFDTNFNTSISNSRQWYDDKFREDIYTNTGYGKLAKIPVKIWAAKDDGDVPYQSMIETVAQMQNTGTHAEISIVDVGGHSVFDVDNTYAQSVTTKLGVYYEKVPLGWVELVKWVRQNSVKPIN